ncbi:probable G-protein coupled receptor 139 [Narcine bancroftii]|uniref:probable G-protein coupled receptor 139 n=1 Tax=Narcine bancroftii TaxID=1343680 RepID=UPI0038313EC3
MHGRVSGLVYAIYYPVLAALGVAGNLVTIVILSRGMCGLSRCITRYLMWMAVTDLLVLITAVILDRISTLHFPVLFLHTTPVCSLRLALIFAARDSSVWLTVAFTFDRFVSICCQKLKSKYSNKETAAVVIGVICTVSCVKNIPMYFALEPLSIIDNVPWFCNLRWNFYSDVLWTMYNWMDHMLNPCAPFLLMILLNALTVRYILAANRARRRVKGNVEEQIDSEMQNRRKSIVLLFTISGSFLVLWATYVANFLFVRFVKSNYMTGSNPNNPRFIFQECGVMLQLLSCCTNTCIYAGTQRKFREELKKGLKFPLKLIGKKSEFIF